MQKVYSAVYKQGICYIDYQSSTIELSPNTSYSIKNYSRPFKSWVIESYFLSLLNQVLSYQVLISQVRIYQVLRPIESSNFGSSHN